jgi:tetratricopeptide (TPR) repeat protein
MTRSSLFALTLSLIAAAPLTAQDRPSIFPPLPRGHLDPRVGGVSVPGSVFWGWPVHWADPVIVYIGNVPYIYYPGYGYTPYYPAIYGWGYGYRQQYGYGMQQQIPPQNNNPPVAALPKEKPPVKEAPKPDSNDALGQMYRLIRLGNRAFASGQYEDALKQYEKAQAFAPMEPHPAFHAAQAHVAMGNYHKAFAEIRRGLRWQPHWPESPFQPRALYAEKSPAFQKHLARLADAAEKNPNDDSLLFLLGYALWFDGKRDQAEVLFKRAAALTMDRGHIDRFLQVKDKGVGGS